MKEPGNRYVVTSLFALVIALILSESEPVLAQKAPQPYPPPKSSQAQQRAIPIEGDPRAPKTGEVRSLDAWRREGADTETILLRRRVAAELTEDFEQLKRINRERIVPLSSSATLDYKYLSELAGEINSRAKRIRGNIPFALKEKKGEKVPRDADPASLASMLPELSRLIDSFLGSRVFHVTSVDDGELRVNAGQDLVGINRLSETIAKAAKRLQSVTRMTATTGAR